MIENFGSYLKAERELRGVTLEELHAKTKIPIHFLQALEKNKFDELPEQVFIKGYIRSFAKVIGANEDEVLSTYIDITKTAPSTDIESDRIPKQNDSSLDPKFIFILIFTILFLSGAVWGVNTLIRKLNTGSNKSILKISEQKQNELKENLEESPSTKNQTTEEVSTMLNNNELSSKTSIIKPEITIETSSKTKSRKPVVALENSSVTVNDMPLKLTIKIKNNVWFNIAIDDSPMEDFVLPKGSEKIFYGKNQYLLSVGNQNHVDLTLNGIKVNFPNENKKNRVKDFIINSKLVE
jgi:cytoskeleton protein RodZ